MRQAALNHARRDYVETAEKRTGRYGAEWWRPMWWGTGAVPDTIPLMVAHVLSGNAPEFLWPQYTNCDAMLGGNPLNMVWVTGLGERSPEQVFQPDSWYTSPDGRIVPGIVPEGPYKYSGEGDPKSGPWDPKFVQSSAYPPAGEWPPLELYFEARTCYPMNEFTVAQMARAAAAYGYLCSRTK